MIDNMPSQAKIDLFWQTFNAGYSVTYSMSLAKITGKQYRAFLDSSEEARNRIQAYKEEKHLSRKCNYKGIQLTYEQCARLGLKKEFEESEYRKEQIERTKQILESISEIKVNVKNDLLPRGIS
jgi:hypothetical protein